MGVDKTVNAGDHTKGVDEASAKATNVVPFVSSRSGAYAAVILQRFVSESGAKLRGYLQRRCTDTQEVEDIVQETYCRLLEHPDPKQIEQPHSFLFRVAVNLLIDNRRREGRSVKAEEATERGFDSLDFNELNTAYQRELNTLPPVCQQVFVLCRHQGLNSEEIASRLGISRRMVQKHLAKAIKHFSQRLR